MVLHDHVLSAEGYAVRLMAALSGLVLDHRVVDILAGPATPPPLLEIDAASMTGVRPILLHLAGEAGGGWLPAEPAGRAAVLDWLDFAAGNLSAARRLREIRLFGRPGDAPALERAVGSAYRRLDDHLAERLIEGSPFLVGSGPTIADVACFPAVALSDDVGVPLDRFHAVSRFVDAVTRLPGFVPMPGVLVLPDPLA
jgi:glutathione S-transferase